MTLEDFEKELAKQQAEERSSRRESESKSHRHRHRHRHHHRSKHEDGDLSEHRGRERRHESGKRQTEGSEQHSHKHNRSGGDESSNRKKRRRDDLNPEEGTSIDSANRGSEGSGIPKAGLQRDAWMEAPPVSEFEYTHTRPARGSTIQLSQTQEGDRTFREDQVEEESISMVKKDDVGNREVDYSFGDAGSGWRMTKLKAVYSQAQDTGRSVDEVAIERYGDLQSFDEAREEEIELERRRTYGNDYIGKERPTGKIYQERKLSNSPKAQDSDSGTRNTSEPLYPEVIHQEAPVLRTMQLDQTALNRLKAQMMKAKLRNSPDALKLEADYTAAMASIANQKEPEVVILGARESRMLAASQRQGGTRLAGKTDEDSENMTIEEMVREERMTRGQQGGEGRRFAERIANDTKFDNNLDYLDENASKLARRVQKSELNLKNTTIQELQKMNRVLDKCPLCYHEDTNKVPIAPVISLGTRVYLTLPTMPEISGGSACIVPIQHRVNLLECDDDEWEEIRNFMKCLKRMYHDQGRDVIFYENAAAPSRRRHAALEAVPLPHGLAADASAFFKEAILSSDEEWTQHRKIIDTLSKARDGGLGKLAFRRTLAKEMPYFHVWLDLDGGVGHIVEDADRWPKGDLFAREVLGGMLDVGPEIIRRQGRWSVNGDGRVEDFKKAWTQFDWTKLLTQS